MLYAVVAMQNEADTLRSAAKILKERTLYGKRVLEGNAFGHDFGMVLCGVGKTNAAAGTMLALTLGADKILNFGVAGGIVPEAKLGSLWQVERAVQYDFDLHAVNGTPVGTLNEYETPYLPLCARENAFRKATLATGDRFTDGSAEAPLYAALGAQLREMEGAAVAHIAYAAGVPCYAFKSVSDCCGEDCAREYYEKLQEALAALRGAMPAIFAEVLHG